MKQCEGCGYNVTCADRVDGRMGELREECAVADDMTPEQTEACNQGQCPCRCPVTVESYDEEVEDVGAVVIDSDNLESLRFDAIQGGLQMEYCYSEWVTGSVYEDRTDTHVCRSREGIKALRDTCRTLANSEIDRNTAYVLMDCEDTLMTIHLNGAWYYLRVYIKACDEGVTALHTLCTLDCDWDGIGVDMDDYPLPEFLDDLADECDELLGRD